MDDIHDIQNQGRSAVPKDSGASQPNDMLKLRTEALDDDLLLSDDILDDESEGVALVRLSDNGNSLRELGTFAQAKDLGQAEQRKRLPAKI